MKTNTKKIIVTAALVLVFALGAAILSGAGYPSAPLRANESGCSGCSLGCAACAACTACTCLSCLPDGSGAYSYTNGGGVSGGYADYDDYDDRHDDHDDRFDDYDDRYGDY